MKYFESADRPVCSHLFMHRDPDICQSRGVGVKEPTWFTRTAYTWAAAFIFMITGTDRYAIVALVEKDKNKLICFCPFLLGE